MNYTRQSIGRENAIALCKNNWWEGKTHRELAEFQMLTKELSMPFAVFHEALEKTLGRPVYSHEIGLDYEGLLQELFGERPAPSFQEILNLIPEEKRILVTL